MLYHRTKIGGPGAGIVEVGKAFGGILGAELGSLDGIPVRKNRTAPARLKGASGSSIVGGLEKLTVRYLLQSCSMISQLDGGHDHQNHGHDAKLAIMTNGLNDQNVPA